MSSGHVNGPDGPEPRAEPGGSPDGAGGAPEGSPETDTPRASLGSDAPEGPSESEAVSAPSIEFERALNARVVLFHEAVAGRLGLNPTDLKCLDLMAGDKSVSPGRLAELSGLTTGAITGVLDRLEAAGMVRRELDPVDRRRFTVRLLPDRLAELDAMYRPFQAAMADAMAAYGPLERLAIVEFLGRRRDLLERETDRLRVLPQRGFVGDMFSTPLGSVTRGTLVFESGAARFSFAATAVPGAETRVIAEAGNSRLVLTGNADPVNLCQTVFTGPVPEINASGGSVTVRYRFRGFFQRRSAEIALNPRIPWTIVVKGGLSELVADLTRVELGGFELKGGATDLRMDLPEPRGSVRLLLKGNATSATLRLPVGVALGLDIAGTVERLSFAGQRLTAVHGKGHLETPAYGSAANRYQALYKGNAGRLSVTL